MASTEKKWLNAAQHHMNWRNPIHLWATGFGSGLSAIMPGTCGTVIAIPIYLILYPLGWTGYIAITLLLILLSIAASAYMSTVLQEQDPSAVVCDEIVGFLCVMILVPHTWWALALGFLSFRCFDICKPWPMHRIENQLTPGLAIVMDDLAAALYAWITVQVCALLILRT